MYQSCLPKGSAIYGELVSGMLNIATDKVLASRGVSRDGDASSDNSGVSVTASVILSEAQNIISSLSKEVKKYIKTVSLDADLVVCNQFLAALEGLSGCLSLEGYNAIFGLLNIVFPNRVDIRGIRRKIIKVVDEA